MLCFPTLHCSVMVKADLNDPSWLLLETSVCEPAMVRIQCHLVLVHMSWGNEGLPGDVPWRYPYNQCQFTNLMGFYCSWTIINIRTHNQFSR